MALPRLIVCVTGMPGSGKTTVAEATLKIGFHVVSMGDVVREEAVRRNLKLNDENLGAVMVRLREELGPGAVAKLCLPKIAASNSSLVIVDGLRSFQEFCVFKEVCSSRLLAVHASPQARFSFLRKRGREDDPSTWEAFEARDRRELRIGVGEAMALSDEALSNNSVTVEELQGRAIRMVRRWLAD